MNNRITKIIANTVGLGAVAALGITVYQMGTSPLKEEGIQEERIDAEKDNEEKPIVDAGTDRVEANLENREDDLAGESEEESKKEKASDDEENSEENESAEDGSFDVEDEEKEEAEDVSATALALPEIDFSEDTLMEWPVNGNILVDYSMDQTTYFPTLDQYKLSPAISVQSVEGAPVMAAVNGTIYSVEQEAQTGTTVTMELGNGYQAVYGQLSNLAVAEGDTVKKGEIIGYVGAPTKYYSLEGSNLYFAMKKDGTPIDPIIYLP